MNGYQAGSGLNWRAAHRGPSGAPQLGGISDDASAFWETTKKRASSFGQNVVNDLKSTGSGMITESQPVKDMTLQIKTGAEKAARDQVQQEVRGTLLPAILGALVIGGGAVYLISRR